MNGDDNIGSATSSNWVRAPSPGEASMWASANFFATDSPFLVRDAYELMNLTYEESGAARMLEWRPGSSDRTTMARLLRAGRARLFGIEGAPLLTARGKSLGLRRQEEAFGTCQSSVSPQAETVNRQAACDAPRMRRTRRNETHESRRGFSGESGLRSRCEPECIPSRDDRHVS